MRYFGAIVGCIFIQVWAGARELPVASTPPEKQPFSIHQVLTGIVVTPNNDAEQLVNGVFRNGSCFETYNPTTTGDPRQIGTFSNGMNALGMSDGIILSTGLAKQAEGPNNSSFTQYQYDLQYTDPDLASLAGNNIIYDMAVLEFDFRPTSDEISFEYVFASEEYCEIVSPGFNDVFAFFISGPGINGPYANNAKNIALVPNSNQVVSVSSINHFTNSLYYRNNTPASFGDVCGTGTPVAPNDIEFDGFTTVLTARSPVIPCQTYHLKIVIADIGDDIYDSALFLNAGSFDAGLVNVTQENLGTFATDDRILVEGCGLSRLIFSRSNGDTSNDLWVRYTISPLSTAIEGEDYESLPDSFLIAAGRLTDTLVIQSIADGIPEDDESILLFVENSCDCQGAFIELMITDPPILTSSLPPSLKFCATDSLAVGPMVSGGVAPYRYTWSDMSTDSAFVFTPVDDNQTYRVSVTDYCGQTQVHDIAVAIDSVTAALSGVYPACNTSRIPIVLNGATQYEVTVDRNGNQETYTNLSGDTLWLSPNGAETIALVSVSGDGCMGFASGTAEVTANEIQINSLVTEISCFGQMDGGIALSPEEAPGPFSYQWSDPNLTGNNPQNLPAGTYRVTITDAVSCQYAYTFPLTEPAALDVTVNYDTPLTCDQPATVRLSSSGGTPSYAFLWSEGETANERLFTDPGTYPLSVTDANGCLATTEVLIDDHRDFPLVDIDPSYTLDCTNPVRTIRPASIDDQLQYRWIDLAGDTIGNNSELALSNAGAFRLIVRDPANGCVTENAFTVVDDREDFIVFFQQNQILTCRDDRTELLALFEDPPADLEINWTSDGGPLGNLNPVGVSLADGPFIYLESYSASTGCRQLDTFSLLVDTLAPVADLGFSSPLTCSLAESSLFVASPAPDWTFDWQTGNGRLVGATDQAAVRADRTGSYQVWITDTLNGCSRRIEIDLTEDYRLAEAQAGPDRSLSCTTETTELRGGALPPELAHRLRWLDTAGEVLAGGAAYSARTAGTYILEARHAESGCLSYDTLILSNDGPEELLLEVESDPCAELGNTVRVVGVTGGTGPYRYRQEGRSDFQADGAWNQVAAGEQVFTVRDVNGCTFSRTVSIIPDYEELRVSVPSVVANYGMATAIQVTVNRSENEFVRYEWTDPDSLLSCTDCASPTLLSPRESTTLLLRVTDGNGCQVILPVGITVDRRSEVYVPTAIYPGSTREVNRSFAVFGSERVVEGVRNLAIYDRWGEEVFAAAEVKLNDPQLGWDGYLKGQPAAGGVYLYRFELSFRDGRRIIESGHFTLLR